MGGKKMEGKKIKRKVSFISCCLDEEKMERKENDRYSFFCLDWKKSERKENEIILNDIYTLIITSQLI